MSADQTAIRSRPHVLCVMQLPPPIHGVTVINEQIASSRVLAERFELTILPLQFSEDVAGLGKITIQKLVRASTIAARLIGRLATQRPDAVYFTLAVQRPALYRDLALLSIVRAACVPRIVHLHACPEPAVLPILRHGLQGATVILLSPRLRASFGDAVTDDQIRYVANGMPDLGDRDREQRVPRVLFLSNLLVAKGPLVLVEALAELARRGIDCEATFAGAPSQVDPARLPNYRGAVTGEMRARLFRDHDIFAYPSSRDAFPLAVIEAMSAGLAIVASDVGAIAEITGGTALLVPANDPHRLADALARLIAAPHLRAELGRAARERYLANYTVERFEAALAATISWALV